MELEEEMLKEEEEDYAIRNFIICSPYQIF
jgi:hypothetical protein